MRKFAAVIALCLPLLGQSQATPLPGPVNGTGLSSLREQLGLQAVQEAAWEKYEAAVNAYIAVHYQERPVLASRCDTAPAQIRRLVDLHANRLAALEDIETATQGLYRTLSPTQQELANQNLLASIPVIGAGAGSSAAPSDTLSRPDRGHRPGGPAGPGGGMGR